MVSTFTDLSVSVLVIVALRVAMVTCMLGLHPMIMALPIPRHLVQPHLLAMSSMLTGRVLLFLVIAMLQFQISPPAGVMD